jgi:flagellar biosynthesis anti-sigma factor FlgM
MKIDANDLQTHLNVYKMTHVQGNDLDTTRSEKRETATAQQDRVDFSERGRLIAEAQQSIASVPDIRESLVSRIQAQLEDGTYTVDSQKAAEGILRESMTNLAAMT